MSFKRYFDTVLVEKMLHFKVPAAHTAFQQARRRALPRYALGRASIFRNDEDDGVEDSPRAGNEGSEQMTSQLHT
jgi:hypothetical protein